MRVCAVVVNWNGGDDNLACVQSLQEQGPALDQIVFVDNASTDGSWQAVRERHPDLVFLVNETNDGYGGGNNQGFTWALEHGFDAVLVVNNDVVLPAGQLDLLVAVMAADDSVGLVGPRVLDRADPARPNRLEHQADQCRNRIHIRADRTANLRAHIENGQLPAVHVAGQDRFLRGGGR